MAHKALESTFLHLFHKLHEKHQLRGKYSSCVWIIKCLLSQILKYHIEPTELCGKVKSSQFGKYSLTPEESTKCCSESSEPPDYEEFDAELLYKLIKNLCPLLKPKKGWGEKPDIADIELGDDVERLIHFNDELSEYADPSYFDTRKYEWIWNEIKSASERIHKVTKAKSKRFWNDFKETKYTVSEIRRYRSEEQLLRKNLLEKNLPILHSITGFKDDKTVMKVFLCGDDIEEREIKDYYKEIVFRGSGHVQIDIFNIDKESEGISNYAEEIQLEEEKCFDLDESTEARLEEIITRNQNHLYLRYSNIIAIGKSNVRYDGRKFLNDPCIVLYCLDKHIVPFGEEPLPPSIEGWPCDHRDKVALQKHFFLFDKLLSDRNFVVKSWKRKDMPDTEILKENPHILHYISGVNDKKTVIKIFVRGGDKNEKIKEDLNKAWFPHSKDITIEFYNIGEGSKGISNYAQEIKREEKRATNLDESTRTQLQEAVKKNENHLYRRYSNIIGIAISNVRYDGRKFLREPCIVLYCLDKYIVPFGEKPLPPSIEGWPCDHREDFAMLEMCPFPCPDFPKLGCSIGPDRETSGSVGFMVQTQNDSKATGFLTAAHVAVTNLENKNHFPKVQLGTSNIAILHPSPADDGKKSKRVGRVVEAYYGNYDGRGLDVAFIEDYIVREVNEELPVTVDDDLIPFEPDKFKVTKIGKTTGITTGYIKHILFSMRNWRNSKPFKDCYSISSDESSVFSAAGDSGSGVFWVQTDETHKPLGILIGGFDQCQLKVVCKIDKFLNTLGLKIVRCVNQK